MILGGVVVNGLEKYIEHTLLKPEATVADIIKLCTEARSHQFYAVCVNPCYVELARHLLTGSWVKVVTVVGFPLGATYTEVKALETKLAVENHADEIDMVMNLAAFKTGDYAAVLKDIRAVVNAAKPAPVKVIIETCLLTETEKVKACELVIAGGASFVKTSTGFAAGGATEADVALLKAAAVAGKIGVKAAGGIRDAATAQKMVAAGADRLGTSAGVAIAEAVL